MLTAFQGTLRRAFPMLALAVCLGTAQPVSAQDEEKIAKTRQLIETLNMIERADSLMTVMMTQMQALVTSANPGKEDVAADLMQEKFMPAMRRHLPGYVELVVGLYAEHFTLAELEETIAFYQSPTGRKWVETQPIVLAQTQRLAVGWAQKVVAEVMREVEADFQKRGLELPPI